MTKEEIKKQIKELEEDNATLHDYLYNGRPTIAEKSEIRNKIKANNLGLIRLKNALVCMNENQ